MTTPIFSWIVLIFILIYAFNSSMPQVFDKILADDLDDRRISNERSRVSYFFVIAMYLFCKTAIVMSVVVLTLYCLLMSMLIGLKYAPEKFRNAIFALMTPNKVFSCFNAETHISHIVITATVIVGTVIVPLLTYVRNDADLVPTDDAHGCVRYKFINICMNAAILTIIAYALYGILNLNT